jgi:hypothetical protein
MYNKPHKISLTQTEVSYGTMDVKRPFVEHVINKVENKK